MAAPETTAAQAPDTLKQRAVRGTLWYGGSRWALQAVTWVVTIFVARLLSPADYGLYGFALMITGLVELISELGLGAAIIQRRDLNAEDLETVFWLTFGASVTLYAIVWFTAPAIAGFFNQPKLITVLRVIMLNFVIVSFQVVSWNLMTKKVDFKHRSIAEMISSFSAGMTTLGLAFSGFGVWALVGGDMAGRVMVTASCLFLQPWRPRGHFSYAAVRKVGGFGATVAGSRFVFYLYSNADYFVVGKLLGQQMLGFYTMVFNLATAPVKKITAIINQVAFPVYSELQQQPERFKTYFLKSTALVSTVTFPAMMGFFAVADIAVPTLLTTKWSRITTPLQIMCGLGCIMSVSTLIGPSITAKGRADLALKQNLLSLCIMPVAFAIGAWKAGMEGVCWAWLLAFPVVAGIWYSTTRPLIGYRWIDLFAALRPATVCTAGMLAAVWAARQIPLPQPILRLALLMVTGAASYAGIFALLFRAQLVEIRQLFSKR